MSTTLPEPHLVQELHCLDHDPCRCTQRACQRPCRVTAAVVHNKGHVSIHVTVWTTKSSCHAQKRARQHPHPRTHCLDHHKQLSCTTTGTSASTAENCTVWTEHQACTTRGATGTTSTWSKYCNCRTFTVISSRQQADEKNVSTVKHDRPEL